MKLIQYSILLVTIALTANSQTKRVRSYGPDWSPDGRSIVYYSNRDGNDEIYEFDLESEVHQRLTFNDKPDALPKYSPNGNLLVYFSGNENTQIYIYDFKKKSETRVTTGEYNHEDPNWIGNNTIVFNSDETGNFEIYSLNLVSKEKKKLTNNPLRDYTANWSEINEKIVFVRGTLGETTSIFTCDIDGSNEKQLTHDLQTSTPTWSPNGKLIYFQMKMEGNNIFSMDAGTGKRTRLTFSAGNNSQPVPSPDGKSIAFASNRDSGNYEIYTMDIKSKKVNRVTFDSTPKK